MSLADMSPLACVGLPELRLTDFGDLPDLRVSCSSPEDLELPKLGEVENEDPVSPYHLEILCEKTACADVLDRIARRHSLNVIYGAGDMSETRCQELMRRIVANGGRKVRLLYISDHDPKGHGMPVGVARKLEFMIQRDGLNIDLQLRHIALTKEQCAEYDLPRIPIKATDRGRARFEAEFGEGRVELDALEALHPGALARIVETEIARYHLTTMSLTSARKRSSPTQTRSLRTRPKMFTPSTRARLNCSPRN